VAVAVSGGRDSTALWHATARAAAGLGLDVVGLHVHHGLQPEADAWLAHLQRQARRWASRGLPVRLDWRRLSERPQRGDSVEAWARRARYAALAEMATQQGAGLVLLAHHRRDQAETFLLQALRGAGPAGLAAMPRSAHRLGLVWARPWLGQSSDAIDSYLRRHRLRHVLDLSNADPRYARSRLRQQLWPHLQAAFPDAEAGLCASARRAQEAAEGLRELAALDLQACTDASGALRVAAWSGLSDARRALTLRSWLSGLSPKGAAESLVQRLRHELGRARPGSRWPGPDGPLYLHAGLLRPGDAPREAPSQRPPCLHVDLSREGVHPVPEWGGAFIVRRSRGGGIDPAQLQRCELRPRLGGERFQLRPGTMPRCLKKQYQACEVPAWMRGGPLAYAHGALVYVPGLGLDARRQAPPGVRALQLLWQPEPGGPGSAARSA